MATVHGTVQIQVEMCKGCEICIDSCPQDSLALSKEINAKGYHYAVLVQDNCTGCVNCALVCPDAVITVYRSRKDGKSAAKREQVAVISNVKSNVRVVLDDQPQGGIDI